MRAFSFLTDKTPVGTNLFVIFQQIDDNTPVVVGFSDNPTEVQERLTTLNSLGTGAEFFVLASSFMGRDLQSMYEVAELIEQNQLKVF